MILLSAESSTARDHRESAVSHTVGRIDSVEVIATLGHTSTSPTENISSTNCVTSLCASSVPMLHTRSTALTNSGSALGASSSCQSKDPVPLKL